MSAACRETCWDGPSDVPTGDAPGWGVGIRIETPDVTPEPPGADLESAMTCCNAHGITSDNQAPDSKQNNGSIDPSGNAPPR